MNIYCAYPAGSSDSDEDSDNDESESGEDEDEDAPAVKMPSPAELQGREGRRRLLEYQKKVKEAEEQKRREAFEKHRLEMKERNAEMKIVLAEKRRREHLDEEYRKSQRRLVADIVKTDTIRSTALGTDRQHRCVFAALQF